MEGTQRPIELILARNLMSSLSTPAFLVDIEGMMAFYNEAAGKLLGRPFEEAGPMPAEEWTRRYGPFDEEGNPIPFGEIGLTTSVMTGRPSHGTFVIRAADEQMHTIEASAMPIVATGGQRGAMVFFWTTDGKTA